MVDDGKVAYYQAPGVVPKNNPVAVSVEFTQGRSKTIAVSSVHVLSGGWSGTLSWTLTGTATTTDDHDTNTWTVSGSGMISSTAGSAAMLAVESVSSSTTTATFETFTTPRTTASARAC